VLRELTEVARGHGIDFWARGGWALDLFLGRVTREHEDVDLFAWARDADTFVEALTSRGYEETGGPPPQTQRNLVKDGVELHLALLERNPSGDVVAAPLPSQWGPWPEGMLAPCEGRIGDVACPIITPEAQLDIKRVFRRHRPDRPERTKERTDIELLEAALRAEQVRPPSRERG
jgi:Aminoglycoside-2''-adenylyltransferase